MHPSISINTLCLPAGTLGEQFDTIARLGARAATPDLQQVLEAGPAVTARLRRDAQLEIAALTHRAFGFASPDEVPAARERLIETIAIAAEIGAQAIIMTTGGRGPLSWTEAAAAFVDTMAPCAEAARSAGIRLGIEPTSHLYADVSIAHRLSDTVNLARRAGIAVMIDTFGCWFDSDIDEALAAAAPISPLVQVSDYVYGDRGLPCRAVPGDGAVPWARIIETLTANGFGGWYDMEIIGPRLHAEGACAGLKRAADHIGRLLTASGAQS